MAEAVRHVAERAARGELSFPLWAAFMRAFAKTITEVDDAHHPT